MTTEQKEMAEHLFWNTHDNGDTVIAEKIGVSKDTIRMFLSNMLRQKFTHINKLRNINIMPNWNNLQK